MFIPEIQFSARIVPEGPYSGRAPTNKITSLFLQVIDTAKEHPKKTVGIAVVTAALGAGLISTGITVAIVAGAILAAIALAACTAAFGALYRYMRERDAHASIHQLELASKITSKEALDLKAMYKNDHVRYLDVMKGISTHDVAPFPPKLESACKGLPCEGTLTDAYMREDYRTFRLTACDYFTERRDAAKAANDLVGFYTNNELLNYFKGITKDELFSTFARVIEQEKMLSEKNQLLDQVIESAKQNDTQGTQEAIHKLYNAYQTILANYVPYSTDGVDYVYANYVGEFNKKFRALNDLVKSDHEFCAGCHLTDPQVAKKHSEFPLDPLHPDHVMNKQYLPVMKNLKKQHVIDSPLRGKAIAALTVSFGTGHKVAAEAIGRHLQPHGAHFSVIDPREDVYIEQVDTVRKIGRIFNQVWKSAEFFGWILKHQLYWLINIEYRLDRFFRSLFNLPGKNDVLPREGTNDTEVKERLRKRLLMERPDLLVTTYHMDLNPTIEVAEELGLPLLHMPTDYEMKMWQVFGRHAPTYKHFKSLLPDDNAKTKETAAPLTDEQLAEGGILLRPELYRQFSGDEIRAIREEKGIDPEAEVVLVSSGGGGQDLPYPDLFMNAQANGKKYHVIVIAGANNDLGDSINARKKDGARFVTGNNPNVTVEVAQDPAISTPQRKYFIGGEENAKLRAIASCSITKPGGLTVDEQKQCGVPVILDARVTPMIWEGFNIDVIIDKGRGFAYYGDASSFLELVDKTIALGKNPVQNNSKKVLDLMAEMIASAAGG